MSSKQAIRAAVESLTNVDVTQDAKLHNYTLLREVLGSVHEQKVNIEDDDTIRCLLACANSDVTSKNSRLQQSALVTLDLLFKCKCKDLHVDGIPDVYIKVACDVECRSDVQESALNCIKSCLRVLIIRNKFDPEKLLCKLDTDVSQRKISDLLYNTCTEIPCLTFFYNTMIPCMFETSSVNVRNSLVENALQLLPRYPMTLLSNNRLEAFKGKIKTSYVERVIELRISKYPKWHHMWIFLSQCCGKILHVQVDIMNSLLKAVESAFRSSIMDDRLAAYDCWKELIDNYSLDIERMCNPKQMKLIVTPLKTNVSKNENVIYKRFEIWTHLIGILQQRAFVCLEPFLVFCFGPLGENPSIAVENPDIRSPGRKVSRLWQETTRALLELIGHYGHAAEHPCMEIAEFRVVQLHRPVINSNNFSSLDYQIINSVGECSSLMLQWMDKSMIEKVIRCLWGSLLNIVKQLTGRQQEVAIERVTLQLVVYIQASKEKPDNFEYILKPVLDLLLLKQFFPIDIYNKMFLFPLIKCFLKHSDILFVSGRKIILDLVSYGKNTDCKSNWFKQAYNVLTKVDIRNNLSNLFLFWMECADVLINLCRNSTESTTQTVQSLGLPFMMWPVANIQKIPLKNIANDFIDKWGFAFEQLHKLHTTYKESLIIILDLQSSIKGTPSTVSSVVMLLRCFCSVLGTDSSDKFVNSVVDLGFDLLNSPSLTKYEAGLVLPLVVMLLDVTAQKTDQMKKSTFQDLCHCCKWLLQPHAQFKILQSLDTFLDKVPATVKESVPESLVTVISSLKTSSDDSVSGRAKKLLGKLTVSSKEPVVKLEKAFTQPKLVATSRAAKITHMARATPPKTPENTEELTIRIFQSPAGLRGSQMGNADRSKRQKRKASNAFYSFSRPEVVDEGDEANFVLIDNPYQFDPKKLSEHQVEVMKRRRSDIPALYQDLSQSQSSSQSLFQTAAEQPSNKAEEKVDSQKETACPKDHLFNLEKHSCPSNLGSTMKNIFTKRKSPGTKKGIHIIEDITLRPASGVSAAVGDIQHFISIKNCSPKTQVSSNPKAKKTDKSRDSPPSGQKTPTELPPPQSKLLLVEPITATEGNSTKQNQKSVAHNDLKLNLQVKNPTSEQIEAIIADTSTPLQPKPEEAGHKGKLAELPVEDHGDLSPATEKNLKKLSRVQKELAKIKMDIVGGDAFVQNLDLSGNKVKTRGKTELSGTLRRLRQRKNNYDSDDSRGSSDSGKSKFRAKETILGSKSKDRRTLSPSAKDKLASPRTNKYNESQDKRTLSPRSCNKQRGQQSPVSSDKAKDKVLPSSPGKGKLSNGDVKSPTRCKLLSKFNESENDSGEKPSKRGRKRKSVTIEETHSPEETEDLDDKRELVRKCFSDILGTAGEKIAKNNEESKAKSGVDTEQMEPARLGATEEAVMEVATNLASQNSEDVIESSQESFVEINPRQNCPKPDSSGGNKTETSGSPNTDLFRLNSEIKQIVTQISLRQTQNSKVDNNNDALITISSQIPSSPSEEPDCRGMNVETAPSQDPPSLGVCSPDELMRIDLTSRITDLSSGDKSTCELDTQTQEVTPKKTLNIPSSPVSADTPTRTRELIDNTIDISPIKGFTRHNKEISQKTPDLFDSEACVPEIGLGATANKNLDGCESSTDRKKPEATSITKSMTSLSNPSSRTAKLLNLVSCTPSPKSNKKFNVSNVIRARPNILAQKGHRTIKMMQNCEQSEDTPKAPGVEVVQIEDSDDEAKGCIPEKDLLQFIRVLPDPAASPKCGILKRRRTPEMTDEGWSPPRKQKRVNFSDPPLTCQKVFIQDENEHVRFTAVKKFKEAEPLPGPLRINFPNFNILYASSVDTQINQNSENVFTIIPPEATCLEVGSDLLTQGSVDVADAHLLDREQPIYPELVDCKEDIHNVVTVIANPMYVPVLLEELRVKKIHSVGDLAQLSEVEVNRLPLKAPKVANVRAALSTFTKNQKSKLSYADKTRADESSKIEISSHLQPQIVLSPPENLAGLFTVELQKEKVDLAQKPANKPPTATNEVVNSNGTDLKLHSEVSPHVASNSQFVSRKKIIKRVSLKTVTGKASPSSPAFKNAKILDSPVIIPTVLQKTKASTSHTMDERKKLQGVMPDLIADFKNLQWKATKQGLKLSSLYGTIIEIAGPEVFISILQDNKSLCLTHFIKNNNWSELFREIVDSIGIKKLIFWLTHIPKVSPLTVVDGIFEQLAAKDANIKEIAKHIMETVSLALILKQFGMQRIVREVHQVCQNSDFSAEEFFQFAAFTFSPSIEDMVPSFRHINIVQVENKTVQRANAIEKDLGSFIERILSGVEKSKLPTIFPKEKTLVLYSAKELTLSIAERASDEEVLDSCETLLRRLPKANPKEDTYKTIAQCLFGKIPFSDLWRYFSEHVNNCQEFAQDSK